MIVSCLLVIVVLWTFLLISESLAIHGPLFILIMLDTTKLHSSLFSFVISSGSGKTYTMQPLPLRAVEDLLRLLHQPVYRNQRFKLWLSFFEIYGGKLFDLLSDRKLVLSLVVLGFLLDAAIMRSFSI